MQEPSLGVMGSSSSGGGGGGGDVSGHHDQTATVQLIKAEIASHPLYEQLLAAHVSCLRVATPIDQLPLIDAQLAQSHHVLRSYGSLQQANNNNNHSLSPHERQELDNFLAQYLIVLCTFKEQLQQHVRVHAVEAVMGCREIENTLQALTVIVYLSSTRLGDDNVIGRFFICIYVIVQQLSILHSALNTSLQSEEPEDSGA
ncbi:hypothetical protein CUMW_073970 [Citrus unshiu]|nr:hypothetical protein CUMW_073970 [Citrus unshiu]